MNFPPHNGVTSHEGAISQQDQSDLQLAHRYRSSLEHAPRQSEFRVVALVFISRESITSSTPTPMKTTTPAQQQQQQQQQLDSVTTSSLLFWTDDDRPYLLGTNAEACWIGNSICAERSALALLRWFPSATVNKIVIVTDAPGIIAPGCLCREFMASCDQIPWNTPIVLGGTSCRNCKQKQLAHVPHQQQHDINETDTCIDGTKHDCIGKIVTLASMYPHPSLYVRSKPHHCISFATKWKSCLAFDTASSSQQHKLLQIAKAYFQEQELEFDIQNPSSARRNSLHPISYVAVALYRDKSFSTASNIMSLEYGCSLDAVTQLAPAMNAKRSCGLDTIQIVQVDQYGIAHPPFAPARAFLVEQGYGHVSIFMHDFDVKQNSLVWRTVKALELAPMEPDFVGQLLCDRYTN